jgi:hypothetical protein
MNTNKKPSFERTHYGVLHKTGLEYFNNPVAMSLHSSYRTIHEGHEEAQKKADKN